MAHPSAIEACIRLAQGDVRAAVRWAESSGLSLKDQDLPFPRESEYLALARVAIASSKENPHGIVKEHIIDLLNRLLYAAEIGNRTGGVIEILCLHALARHVWGDFAAVQEAIFRALRLAEPDGFLRLFLDQGDQMHRLLHDVSAGPTPSQPGGYPQDQIDRLLAAFAL
jgi:LuxR family transcriptional regulator, maltose regulon positive regulatory protein